MMNTNIFLISSLLAVSVGAVEVVKPHSLVQKRTIVQKLDVTQVPTEIVCHLEGCAEVQASLEGIQAELKVEKAALDECSRTRQKLQADLASAAKSRAKAEMGLAKCAAERKKLEEELYQ